MNSKKNPSENRKSPKGFVDLIRENFVHLQTTLLVAGTGTFVLGILVWIFFRELASEGLIVMASGGIAILIAALISWRILVRAVFGRRGKYGVNTVVILLTVLLIAGAANYLLFWAASRPNPLGWLRVDTTVGRQTILAEQSITTLENLEEPILVTAFFTNNTPQDLLAWRLTEDILREFKRRSSSQPFEYRRVDPELDPNTAIEYGVSRYPAIAVEATDSRRIETIYTQSDESGTITPFNEKDLITSLLVVNQITQKNLFFVSGHSERVISDAAADGIGWGFAANDLARENYRIIEGTVEELTILFATPNPNDDPAVVIIAGPEQDITPAESNVLSNYLLTGGSLLAALEPGTAEDSPNLANLLLNYGITLGTGQIVDIASSVLTRPTFLQIKAANGQMPRHEITNNFDVLYMPGVVNLGITSEASPSRVPITETGQPYVAFFPLALTTLESWNETSEDEVAFDPGIDTPGPLTTIIAVNAISQLCETCAPIYQDDGEIVDSQIIVIGDADFASNGLLASARNGDLLVNSVNWLAEDFDLITIRPKFREPRLLFLTRNELDFIRWSGWLLMPSLVGLFGIWTWWRRR